MTTDHDAGPIGPHEFAPIDGDEGTWHLIPGVSETEYRLTACSCGLQVLEGRPAKSPGNSADEFGQSELRRLSP